jgi:hypothetical protein
MIPPTFDAEATPPGEVEIFNRLKADPETAGWTVLHSLDIAAHRNRICGELDFVVIIPHKGVLCLEIKSHSRIIRDSRGQWYYGDNPEPDARGPFKQASEAMHSIRDRLVKNRPDLGKMIFWSAVVLPFAAARTDTVEWHPWQLIDGAKFRAQPIARLLLGVIENARRHLATGHRAPWFNPSSEVPTPDQCNEAVSALRPSFEFFESPKSRARRLDEELKRYTAEQFAALDRMESNPRVTFTGPAGTGKTLLAIEAARRAANAGRKVLLVCFNRLLGEWMEAQTEELPETVTTATLHSFMLKTAGIRVDSGSAHTPEFWASELPSKAIDRLLQQPGIAANFDEIIVDEAQDVLKPAYLDFLDLVLKRGWGAGRWKLFGDFEKQTIYADNNLSLEGFLDARGSHAPVYDLRENCRNMPRVAVYTQLLGGLNPYYRKILRPDDGVDPQVIYYNDEAHQVELLAATLRDFLQEGFSLRDITILSPVVHRCAARLLRKNPEWTQRLESFDKRGLGHASFCSVQAFKGLEAPVVILTDFTSISEADSTALFYVGVTRALQRLRVLAAHSVKHEVTGILTRPA